MAQAPASQERPKVRIKKVKSHHDAHHGGSWKVAYADFVTAMMALFLVLWIVSQADVQVKEQIASYFRTPGAFDTSRAGILPGANEFRPKTPEPTQNNDSEVLAAAAAALESEFSSRPELTALKERLKVEMTDEGLHIQILDKADEVSFDQGSAVLTPPAKTILKEVAAIVNKLDNPIYVGGHTDARQYPNRNYTNWELSADRANATRRELETQRVQAKRIRRIVGYADTRPLVPGDPLAPANRRISIVIARTQPQSVSDDEKPPPKRKSPASR
jgi:chemotaxis protein MotB